MCNIAQIVNVLHSLLLTDEDKCIRTSTYYAFEMLKAHRGKQAVKVETGDSSPLGAFALGFAAGQGSGCHVCEPETRYGDEGELLANGRGGDFR